MQREIIVQAGGIDARWRIDGIDGVDLGGARSLDLMRLLQEALTNILKHSRARNAQVSVLGAGGRIEVEVRDDGTGLREREGADVGGGAGLDSMRARARRLGGVLQLASTEAGAVLRFGIPLP